MFAVSDGRHAIALSGMRRIYTREQQILSLSTDNTVLLTMFLKYSIVWLTKSVKIYDKIMSAIIDAGPLFMANTLATRAIRFCLRTFSNAAGVGLWLADGVDITGFSFPLSQPVDYFGAFELCCIFTLILAMLRVLKQRISANCNSETAEEDGSVSLLVL